MQQAASTSEPSRNFVFIFIPRSPYAVKIRRPLPICSSLLVQALLSLECEIENCCGRPSSILSSQWFVVRNGIIVFVIFWIAFRQFSASWIFQGFLVVRLFEAGIINICFGVRRKG